VNEEKTYWGIECRTCGEFIPFGIRPSHSSVRAVALPRPGAYECYRGHKHVYFVEDIHFSKGTISVTEAQMEENRAAYKRIFPIGPRVAGGRPK
jgi:hypothetical protein